MSSHTMITLACLLCATVLFLADRPEYAYAILTIGGVSGGLQIARKTKQVKPPKG